MLKHTMRVGGGHGVCDPLGGDVCGWKVSIGVGWCLLPRGPK